MKTDDKPARGAGQPFNTIVFAASESPLLEGLNRELERQEGRDRDRFSTSSQLLLVRPMSAVERDAFRLAGRPLPDVPGSSLAVVISRNGGRAYVAIPLHDLQRLSRMTEQEIIRALDGPARAWAEAILADRPALADAIANEFGEYSVKDGANR